MEFPDFDNNHNNDNSDNNDNNNNNYNNYNNEEQSDEIQIEDAQGGLNEYIQHNSNEHIENSFPVTTDPAGGLNWNVGYSESQNDFQIAVDEVEEKRILARRQEEDERRRRIVEMMNEEIRVKQEWRDKAREYIEAEEK